MQSRIALRAPTVRSHRTTRGRVISLLGPLTSFGGLVWAVAQPYRVTLLHPQHQGFWWLFAEAPLLVVVAGVVFSVFVARPLLVDLEEGDGAP